MSIRVLEDHVVDQIAAGEVVERPASVLKELVENSLDAGATRVVVRLRDGGAGLVRITDDGHGMDEDDALLCLERHATSKIRAASDLVGVTTFGFRGEALPSIASVSRFQLRTRRAEDDVGTEVRVEGGRIQGVSRVACPVGTDIEVRQLFHAVPARRKFLRTRQTELSWCLEAVRRMIVLRPEVDVTVHHDGREVLRAPASDAERRVRDVVGEDPGTLAPVEGRRGDIVVRGWAGGVGVHRPSASGGIYTFVNGRFVRDRVVRRAITEAYAGVLPKGRYPVVVLEVSLPGDVVDVNVHPAKTEVRFHSPRNVSLAVVEALSASLRPRGPTDASAVRGVVAAEPEGQLDLMRRDEPSRPSAMPDASLLARAVQAPPTPPASRPAALPGPADAAQTVPPASPATAVPYAPPSSPPVPTPPVPRPAPPAPGPSEGPAPLRFLGRVGDVALLARGEALLVLDAVAARRRLDAHRLGRAREHGEVPSQPLLAPVRVTLGRALAARLVGEAEALSALGVEVSAFGPGELAVMALPAGLPIDDPAALLERLAGVDDDAGRLAVLAEASVEAPTDGVGVRTLVAALREAGIDASGVLRELDADDLRTLVARGD